MENFLEWVSQGQLLELFIASLNGLKICEGDFSQCFFGSLFYTSEEIIEVVTLTLPLLFNNGVSWWSRSSVSNRARKKFISSFYIMHTPWNSCKKNPGKQSLIRIQKLLHIFIDGGTIHIYFRVRNCISNHPRSLPTKSAAKYLKHHKAGARLINCPALHM